MALDLPSIDTDESIRKNRLVFENKTSRYFDIISFISFPLTILLLLVVIYKYHVDLSNQNDRIIAFYIFPLVAIGCLYFIYRKCTEARLTKLNTSLPGHKNRELLTGFFAQQGLSVFKETKQLLVVAGEESMSFNNSRMQVSVFILDEKNILFTTLKVYTGRSNAPVFIDHLFFKRDLKQYFSDK